MGDTESGLRAAMLEAEVKRSYEDAALAALRAADLVGCRCPEGADHLVARAQVYATLHHAQNVAWVAENCRERMP